MRGNRMPRPFVPQPRDLHLLREAVVLKVFDRQQAQLCAGFTSSTRSHTRISRLVDEGLLRSFYTASDAGGKKCLYTLTRKGAGLVGSSFSGLGRSSGSLVVGDLFIAHQLEINQIYLTLKYRSIPIPNAQFQRWITPQAPLSTTSRIIPDGYFEFIVPNRTVCCFLEVDLGGETAKIWKSKIEAYLGFAASGQFEEQFQHPQFRVVIATTTDRRAQSLQALTAKYTDKLFWISTFNAIKRDGFWSSVWLRPAGDQRQSFL